MTDQEYPDDELYDSEKRALDALAGEKLPSAELEERKRKPAEKLKQESKE